MGLKLLDILDLFFFLLYADKVEWLRKLTVACVVTCVVLCVVGAIFWFAFGGVVSEPPNNSKT